MTTLRRKSGAKIEIFFFGSYRVLVGISSPVGFVSVRLCQGACLQRFGMLIVWLSEVAPSREEVTLCNPQEEAS